MRNYLSALDGAVRNNERPESQIKADGSPVTKLDLALSHQIEEIFKTHFAEVIFYSEEKYSHWGFPLLALDPLDGTREYVDGRPEWAISLGLFKTNFFEGEGWVYNPMTKECVDEAKHLPFQKKATYRGEVSRSEWKSGLYTKFIDHPMIQLNQMGSIAYKLARLSQGKGDFVVSLWPKNIWDIAGGTLLCQEAGLKFYANGKLVTKVEKVYDPPLIWCHEELFSELSEIFV